jgi:hypothetical protein
MEMKVVNVLFAEKMKEGKKLAAQLLAMHGQAVGLQQQLGQGTASEVTKEETESIKALRSLLEDEQKPDSVEGWAEKIGMAFKTLNAASVTVSHELNAAKAHGVKNVGKTKADEVTIRQLSDIWNKPCVSVYSLTRLVAPGKVLATLYDVAQELKDDYRLFYRYLATFISKDYIEKAMPGIFSKLVPKAVDLLSAGLAPVIDAAVEKAIAKQMDDKVLTIGKIQEECRDVKFYSKNSSDLPTLRRIGLWFHSYVRKEFFTMFSFALILLSVVLVFANNGKDKIIDSYEVRLQNAADKALEFDYLQSRGYATPRTFLFLDSVFVTHRDSATITRIQQHVIRYQAAQKQAVDARIREDMQRKERMK